MTQPTPNSPFSARRPLTLGILALIFLIGGFGSWSLLASISGAVIIPGAIEVEQNRQIVQHPDGGVVADINVKEGDLVEAGEVLIRLDATLLQSRLNVVEGQYYELLARSARLVAERDNLDTISFAPELLNATQTHPDIAALVAGQERLFVSRRETRASQTEQLRKRVGQINSQISGLQAQETALNRQLELIRAELASQKSLLEKGLTQASRVLALQREEASLAGRIGELIAGRAQAAGRMTEIELQITQLAAQGREEAISALRDMETTRLELAEQRISLREQMRRLDIRAPVSGVVHGMQIFAERSVLRPADTVLFLVPQDRPLRIAAQVSPLHIDQVHVGQDVRLQFSTFSTRTTPELLGTVITLSPDAFRNESTGESFYRAEIALNEGEIQKLPEGATLLPGMPVTGFARTQEQTPFAYLVKPFTDYFTKAFRDR
ncbi:HlyD family type I secretion periplasmic adaptor subunit [Aliiroseovarius crassostreae]|uniref:HlyD family type I secretion periplasmic adaptor subunit n=1 Tax=Aliiroseovarius crassostreae TaxID=154981 RepID=UPI0021AE3936|nr:HlyD family type I secretion periplasmic adaptor subunit [Aliiroseovarius crassostreae]UWQ07471.1 HlyD family type I secretion periplasmic adaptor subunit [Aliiroseovarius crassostreae]